MDALDLISLLAGPLVLAGYLVGSATVTWMRRDDAEPRMSDHAVEAIVAVGWSTLAWVVIDEISPGNASSRIGLYSNQVLTAWQSVALWAGLGVTVGLVAPVFRRFDGSPGLGAAGALIAAYYPWLLFGVVGATGAAFAFGRPPHQIRIIAISAALPLAWLAWVLDWIPAWGSANGPEAAVWIMVLTMVLVVRWWCDREKATG